MVKQLNFMEASNTFKGQYSELFSPLVGDVKYWSELDRGQQDSAIHQFCNRQMRRCVYLVDGRGTIAGRRPKMYGDQSR